MRFFQSLESIFAMLFLNTVRNLSNLKHRLLYLKSIYNLNYSQTGTASEIVDVCPLFCGAEVTRLQ